MPSRIPLWDPHAALSPVNPVRGSVTCVGFAHTKGRRCERQISAANRATANRLITELAAYPPCEVNMAEELEMIATCLLCRADHQDQVDEVVARWMAIVRQERRWFAQESEMVAERPLRPRADSEYSTSSTRSRADSLLSSPLFSSPASSRASSAFSSPAISRTSSALSLPASSRASSASASRSSTLQFQMSLSSHSSSDNAAAPEPRRPTARARSQTPSAGAVAASAAQVAGAVVGVTAALQLAPATASPATTTTTTTRAQPQNPPAAPQPAQPPVQQPPQPQPCTRAHGNRRSTAEVCPICRTSMTTSPLDELTWCSAPAGCGRSVHSACFDTWAAHAVAQDMVVTCVLCRHHWTPCAEHDGTTQPESSDGTDPDCERIVPDGFFNPRAHGFEAWSAVFELGLQELFDVCLHRRMERESRRERGCGEEAWNKGQGLQRLFWEGRTRGDVEDVWAREMGLGRLFWEGRKKDGRKDIWAKEIGLGRLFWEGRQRYGGNVYDKEGLELEELFREEPSNARQVGQNGEELGSEGAPLLGYRGDAGEIRDERQGRGHGGAVLRGVEEWMEYALLLRRVTQGRMKLPAMVSGVRDGWCGCFGG